MNAYVLAGLLLCAVALTMFIPAWRDSLARAQRVIDDARAEVEARRVACEANENARWVG